MKQIDIRELNQHAARVMDRVRSGETIEFVQEGRATPPQAKGKIPLPPAASDATRSASEQVIDDRLDERW